MRGRVLILALAAVAVVVAVSASRGSGGGDRAASHGAAARGPTLDVLFVYSPEKAPLLRPLIARFNAENHRSGTRRVRVMGRIGSSGEAESQIAAGKLKPVLWSPASSFWGQLLDFDADRRLVARHNPSIVHTPLVIAMWKRLADAYGYPRRPLGYGTLARLATGGWAAVGRPAFGPFTYVHTNPDYSTSGLEAVVASYYAAAGKRRGLTTADVRRARPTVRRLERSIVHYGDTTLLVADELRRHGLGYASAVAMEETTLIAFNRTVPQGGDRLVAIHPSEGTFISDNPLITLRGGWVTAEQRRVARMFAAFLAAHVTPEVAGRSGFRPAAPGVAPSPAVAHAPGVDVRGPGRILPLPTPRVLNAIKAAWHADRKPANVMIAFDTSGSMSREGKLTKALAGLRGFLTTARADDRIGLLAFSDRVRPLVPIRPMRVNRARLLRVADRLVPDGDTRLRDATLAAAQAVRGQLDPHAVNAVVVLTDGMDSISTHVMEDVMQALRSDANPEAGPAVRVFTIGYGREADLVTLRTLSEAGGGLSFKASQADVSTIYQRIASYF